MLNQASVNKHFLYKMKKTKYNKGVRYRVYDKNGRYQQSYMEYTDAFNCSKHIGGRVVDLEKEPTPYTKDK